ncbi:hypothetical protein AJ87_37300 [Rhizobium yanglingense]|nr:hypothetical protein AJ87_37300 [Rhizobium yanglingense]
MSAAGGERRRRNAGTCQQDGERHGQITGFLFGIDHCSFSSALAAEGTAGGRPFVTAANERPG